MNKISRLFYLISYPALILWIIILASVPPVSRDALTHHLALPKLWLQQGNLDPIPHIEFSYYPQLIDLLYLLPLSWHWDIAAKYIHFSFALLSAALLFLYLRYRLNAFWGALAGLFFLSLPIIIKLSITVYVDLGLIAFFTAALIASLMWLETEHKKWLILAAISTGLALSTKYTALPAFFILSLLLPYFYLRRYEEPLKSQKQAAAIGYALLFVFIALLVFSPWLIRNLQATGNPIYPLYQGLLGGPQIASQAESISPLRYRKLVYGESLPYALAVPIRVFYEGQDDDPQYFDGRLNLLLLLLPLSLMLSKYKKNYSHTHFLFLFSILVLVYTLFINDIRIRYIAAIIPPLIILSIYALHAFYHQFKSKKSARLFLIFIGLIYFIPNLNYLIQLSNKTQALSYIRGNLNRNQYIEYYRPEYRLIQQVNQEGTKVLGLYLGSRLYYFDIPAILVNELFWQQLEQAETAEALQQNLKKLGFSHLLIRFDLFNQVLQQQDVKKQQIVLRFFNDLAQKINVYKGYGLYRI